MTPPIQFRSVNRSFGALPVLEDLTFSVPEQSVTALLGRNGSGKTTAIRCLLGLLRVDRGRAELLGHDAWRLPPQVRSRVGFVSERQTLDERFTLDELFSFCDALDPRWDRAFADQLARRFELPLWASPATLSQGGGRKAGLAVALASRPDVLILDEPAANLDVVVRRELSEVILDQFRREGMSVLLSTHLLTDVERVADRVVMIQDGATLLESNLDDLRESVKAIRLLKPEPTPLPALKDPRIVQLREGDHEALVTVQGFDPALTASLERETGCTAEVRDLPLEEVFLAFARTRTLEDPVG